MKPTEPKTLSSLLKIGDLLYDGEYLGIITEIVKNDCVINWLSNGRGVPVDSEYAIQTTSNRYLLLNWRRQAQLLKERP